MHKPSNGAMGVFRVLVCRVQSRWCGLPLDAVEETLRPQPLRPPPQHEVLKSIRGATNPGAPWWRHFNDWVIRLRHNARRENTTAC